MKYQSQKNFRSYYEHATTRRFRRSGEVSEVDLESNILQKSSSRHRLCIKNNALPLPESKIIQKQTYSGVPRGMVRFSKNTICISDPV